MGHTWLDVDWDELLWAAITIGRPSYYHVFRHGPNSFNEAIFRLALVRMAVEEIQGRLHRTAALAALDPTEKGMVSYFLGMTLCKLFASRQLNTPWLLHLDVFRDTLNPVLLGRSRPDLVGQDAYGNWHAFESKGRSTAPSLTDKAKAKQQAQRLVSVNGHACSLHVGSIAFFWKEVLEFYWRDPEAGLKEPIRLPAPEDRWRYYYEPALSLAQDVTSPPLAVERERADVRVKIHPEVQELLWEGRWSEAKVFATNRRSSMISAGFQPDGVKVIAGTSWKKPFDASR